MWTFCLSMFDNEEDKITFERLYDRCRLKCYRVALKITNNHELAEDAIHNAFLAVIKHKDKIFNLSCGEQESQIVIITKNKAIDLIRMEKNRSHIPLDNIVKTVSNGYIDLSELLQETEGVERIIECISKLPDLYKTVFESRYVNNMSNREIAKLIGITPKAVSTRISRAKEMLKELLKGDYTV